MLSRPPAPPLHPHSLSTRKGPQAKRRPERAKQPGPLTVSCFGLIKRELVERTVLGAQLVEWPKRWSEKAIHRTHFRHLRACLLPFSALWTVKRGLARCTGLPPLAVTCRPSEAAGQSPQRSTNNKGEGISWLQVPHPPLLNITRVEPSSRGKSPKSPAHRVEHVGKKELNNSPGSSIASSIASTSFWISCIAAMIRAPNSSLPVTLPSHRLLSPNSGATHPGATRRWSNPTGRPFMAPVGSKTPKMCMESLIDREW